MLPFANLLSPELLKFDNSLNNMEIMPGDAVEPEISFGNLLASELLELPQPEMLAGEGLPLDGNALPPLADLEMPPMAGLPIVSLEGTLPASVTTVGSAAAATSALQPRPVLATTGQQTVPNASIVDPAGPVVTTTEIASPDALQGRQPPANGSTRLPFGEAVGGEPVAGRETPLAALARMSAGDTGDRQQQATQREALLARGDQLPARQPQLEPVASSAFQAARDDAALELRGLQQLGQQAQQLQPSQPVTPLAHSAQPTLPASLATYRPGAEVPLPVSTPVTDPAWGEQVGERVVMMAGKQLQNAEIRLSPAELGPLRVQIRVDDGAANVTFHAHHAVTRDAIEQALPRLREMFADNGLNLGEASVNEQGIGQQGQAGRDAETQTGSSARYDADADIAAEAEPHRTAEARRILDGLVDTFA